MTNNNIEKTIKEYDAKIIKHFEKGHKEIEYETLLILITERRFYLIKSSNDISAKEFARYTLKGDEFDKLYTNNFERERLKISEAIAEQYLKR